jgi:hypothetical protein
MSVVATKPIETQLVQPLTDIGDFKAELEAAAADGSLMVMEYYMPLAECARPSR